MYLHEVFCSFIHSILKKDENTKSNWPTSLNQLAQDLDWKKVKQKKTSNQWWYIKPYAAFKEKRKERQDVNPPVFMNAISNH